ncbi:MAG TPA: hypothetical protein VNS32_02955 [Flavisolibacter sp.]|nr:hypothetical protein [Flavisolibacter sp.]
MIKGLHSKKAKTTSSMTAPYSSCLFVSPRFSHEGFFYKTVFLREMIAISAITLFNAQLFIHYKNDVLWKS